jgi:hypothetical protein
LEFDPTAAKVADDSVGCRQAAFEFGRRVSELLLSLNATPIRTQAKHDSHDHTARHSLG